MEFASERENTRGRKGDLELHLPFRRDVFIDAERRNTDVVQRARLALHEQRELLPRPAAQEVTSDELLLFVRSLPGTLI